jgi:hypothetical protein
MEVKVNFVPQSLYTQGKRPCGTFEKEAGWEPELVWALQRDEFLIHAGN